MDDAMKRCCDDVMKCAYEQLLGRNNVDEKIEYAALRIMGVLRFYEIRIGDVKTVFRRVEDKIQQLSKV